MRNRILFLSGILLAAWVPIFGQSDRPPFTNTAAALDTSTEVIKRLATVKDHVKGRQWEQAILILQKVEADHGSALVAIDSRRYLNVTTYCNSVLAGFPPEGLAVYREKYDAQAKQWLAAGLASRDPGMLEKIVQNAFVSRPCDEALFVLGEWAWNRGEFALAREYWRTLLKLPNPPDAGLPQTVLRYPDSLYPPAEILSRIALCHLMESDEALAETWLEYLAKEHPEARGKLAGREGVYAEILKEVFKASESWNLPNARKGTLTFAGNSRRNQIYPKAPELGGLQWEVPLPEHRYDPASPRAPIEPSLSYFPIVSGETVFFADPDQIYALDLHTGKAKWPISGDGTIDKPSDLELAAIFKTSQPTPEPNNYRIGVPRFTLTLHEDRLYARMGSPITGQISKSSGTADSQLVCLDLSKQGKMVWHKSPADVLSRTKMETRGRWAFEGSPVVANGRVFAAMRQSHPQTESLVVCLDAETGEPQWTRRAASAVSGIAEQQNYVSHHLLTLGENMVFFVPEFGVVTAIDAASGRLMWAVTYPSVSSKDSSNPLKDPRKQGLTPCVFHRGVVYAAPTDAESVLAISAKSGVILWEQQIPFSQDHIRHLLGVVDDRLVLSGNRLWSLDAITGNVQFPKVPDPNPLPEAYGYGRGLIAEDTIYWPRRSELEVRNLAGERTKQPQPIAGGNLATAGDLLLVAEPKRLAAYGNFAKVKETQKGLLSQNPKAAVPYFRLAQAEAATGDLKKALEQNLQALRLATDEDKIAGRPIKQLARENQFRLLMKSADQAMKRAQPERAQGYFEEAVKYAANCSQKAEAFCLLGDALTQRGKINEAAKAYQAILDDVSLAQVPLETNADRTRGEVSASQIEILIDRHGRGVYAEFDAKASRLLSERLRSKDLEGAQELFRRFPNAIVSSETKHRLAKLQRDRGEWRSAFLAWRDLLQDRLEPNARQQVLWESARTLEDRGFHRPAREIWKQLLREFPDDLVETRDKTIAAKEFVPNHLEREPFQKLDRKEPELPLGKRWEIDRAPETQIVIPDGESPGAGFACLLLQNRELVCLDRSLGTTRWKRQLDHQVLWAAYGPIHLLLGTATSLLAVELETGETIWRVPLAEPHSKSMVHQFELVGDRAIVLKDDEIRSIDAADGRQIWRSIHHGGLSDAWLADAEYIVVQTEDPLRILVFETKTGRRISQHRFTSPWTSPPVRLANSGTRNLGFVVSLDNRRIRAFSPYDPLADPSWEYRDAYSAANAMPRFWSKDGHLIFLIDGDTLIAVHPETGEKFWANVLAHAPLDNPEEAVVLDAEHVFAVTSDQLVCLEFVNGEITWEQPLPKSPGWTLQKQGRFLIALNKGSKNATPAVIFFDAETGRRGQEIVAGTHLTKGRFDAETCVLISENKLAGWGGVDFSITGELTRPPDARDD